VRRRYVNEDHRKSSTKRVDYDVPDQARVLVHVTPSWGRVVLFGGETPLAVFDRPGRHQFVVEGFDQVSLQVQDAKHVFGHQLVINGQRAQEEVDPEPVMMSAMPVREPSQSALIAREVQRQLAELRPQQAPRATVEPEEALALVNYETDDDLFEEDIIEQRRAMRMEIAEEEVQDQDQDQDHDQDQEE
jgi:hypothetical protein